MIFTKISLDGAYVINLDKVEDSRGFFSRFYCKNEFLKFGLENNWPQINTSFSNDKGTLRGLHAQKGLKSEAKMIRCISGSVWDVMVDMRPDSRTYKQWFGVEISSHNKTMVYIPKGFFHGYISLTDNAEVLYMTSENYNPDYEKLLRWNDPDIAIKWPITPKYLSKKDSTSSFLSNLGDIF